VNRRHLETIVMLVALCISPPLLAAGNGGGNGGGGGGGGTAGSHGGGGHSNANQSANQGVSQQNAGGKERVKTEQALPKASKTPAQQLADNPSLSAKLSALMPAGTDLQAASAGFKNLGQFVAAVHVSTNLGLSFTDLKTEMTTGASLGTAIHSLRPQVKAETEATKAQMQAARDVFSTHP